MSAQTGRTTSSRRKTMRTAVVVGAVGGMLLGSTALATAAATSVPSSDGVFTACYDGGGNVKLIPEGASCARGWTGPVRWNEMGQPGARGPQGEQGPQGIPGPAGALTGVHNVFGPVPTTVDPGQSASVGASCPVGEVVLGGGVRPAAAPEQWNTSASYPLVWQSTAGDKGWWWVSGVNQAAYPIDVYAVAVCAPGSYGPQD